MIESLVSKIALEATSAVDLAKEVTKEGVSKQIEGAISNALPGNIQRQENIETIQDDNSSFSSKLEKESSSMAKISASRLNIPIEQKESTTELLSKDISVISLEAVSDNIDLLHDEDLNNPVELKKLDQSSSSANNLEKIVDRTFPLPVSDLNEAICIKDHGYCPIEGNNGHWEGERGESQWCPDPDSIPQKNNPENKTWREVMDRFGIDGISFKDGEPDFSEISKGEIKLDAPESDRGMVFNEADEKLASEKGCSPEEVRQWRKEHGYTWHEKQDGLTVQKVPSIVHGNVSHMGGHSVTTRTQNI